MNCHIKFCITDYQIYSIILAANLITLFLFLSQKRPQEVNPINAKILTCGPSSLMFSPANFCDAFSFVLFLSKREGTHYKFSVEFYVRDKINGLLGKEFLLCIIKKDKLKLYLAWHKIIS